MHLINTAQSTHTGAGVVCGNYFNTTRMPELPSMQGSSAKNLNHSRADGGDGGGRHGDAHPNEIKIRDELNGRDVCPYVQLNYHFSIHTRLVCETHSRRCSRALFSVDDIICHREMWMERVSRLSELPRQWERIGMDVREKCNFHVHASAQRRLISDKIDMFST